MADDRPADDRLSDDKSLPEGVRAQHRLEELARLHKAQERERIDLRKSHGGDEDKMYQRHVKDRAEMNERQEQEFAPAEGAKE